MINQRYYEKPGGFSYLVDELKKRIGKQKTTS